MEQQRIDRLSVIIASGSTRRQTLRLLGAATLGAVGLPLLESDLAGAKRKKKKKHHGHGHGGNGGGGNCTPSGNPSGAFTVNGSDILDPVGNAVLLRGVNKMSVYDDADPRGETYFPEIAKTGANSVRIVWAIKDDQGNTNPNDLKALIDNAIGARLLPMIELHDATGNWNRLNDLVNYWTRPQIVDIIAAHQDALLVNIGNEVGDDQVQSGKFIDGYRGAVQRMRCAGIRTPLVIDAPDYGKNLDVLNASAATLLDADPDHNLIFSVHLYWGIADGADAQFISDKLDEAASRNYPLIVGEFSQYGAYNGNDSICAEGGRIDYQTIIRKTAELGIGWYAWEWGPGNGFEDPKCAVMDMTSDGLFRNLKPGWATEVATTSPYSIKKTSVPIL
ncbi:MAG: cellulase family glycosylhydrolase [Thermomicrobiales bacterium]|nr:cellulase family glycosylhydrolase [Thermomicrobiales bacterium]